MDTQRNPSPGGSHAPLRSAARSVLDRAPGAGENQAIDISAHLEVKLSTLADPDTAAASARHVRALARIRDAEAFTPTRFVWDI